MLEEFLCTFFNAKRKKSFSRVSRRGRPGLEDELAGVVAIHCEVCQHLPGPGDEDGGGDDAAVDAAREQQQEERHGGGEVRVQPEGGGEGHLGRGGVAQPGERAHGHEHGGHEEGDAPAEGAGVRRGDYLGQAALECLQVLAGNL